MPTYSLTLRTDLGRRLTIAESDENLLYLQDLSGGGTGSIGPAGPQGATGSQGDQGIQGATGASGNGGLSPTYSVTLFSGWDDPISHLYSWPFAATAFAGAYLDTYGFRSNYIVEGVYKTHSEEPFPDLPGATYSQILINGISAYRGLSAPVLYNEFKSENTSGENMTFLYEQMESKYYYTYNYSATGSSFDTKHEHSFKYRGNSYNMDCKVIVYQNDTWTYSHTMNNIFDI